LAAIATCLGTISVCQSTANFAVAANARFAHKLAPNNGYISAALSFKQLEADEGATNRIAAASLARLAAGQSPTATNAFATLGLAAQLDGKVQKARRLMAYAQRLSRRDLAVQLFAISDAVERGEVSEALHHYDIAMRTIPGAQDILSPVLAGAVNEPSVRSALVKVLAARPTWAPGFLDFAARAGSNPVAAAALLTELRRKAGQRTSPTTEAAVIDRLMASRSYDQALVFYQVTHPGTELGESRDPRFLKLGGETPSVLDWVVTSEPDIMVGSIEGGGVEFGLGPGGGGLLVAQDQVLAPGTYLLEGQGQSGAQSSGTSLFWALSCINGVELGRVAVANAAGGFVHFRGLFNIPSACPAQILTLVGRPSDRPGNTTHKIDWVVLKPVQRHRSPKE